MKILYLAPDAVPFPKGASVRIERTVRTLRALGHEVRLFTPASPEGRWDFLSHSIVELPQENFLERMLAFRRAAADWLEDQRADAVWFRGIWEGIPATAWARRGGAKAVFEAHGLPSLELPYHYPGLEANTRVLEKLIAEEHAVLRDADRVLTHSQTGRRCLLMRGVRPDRISLVANAVDPDLFSPGAAAPAAGPPWRIVYTGTLAPWQGLTVLLEALRLLRKKEALELHVIGPRKGSWRNQLRGLARRLRVHAFVNLSGALSQKNLVPALRSAHLCAAPLPADPRNAVQGCSPLKVLEYMAVARPILATAVAPLRELLEHDRDARLVMPGSPAALAEGIDWMLADGERREALGRRAREVVLARFSPRHFHAALAGAVETLAEPLEAAL